MQHFSSLSNNNILKPLESYNYETGREVYRLEIFAVFPDQIFFTKKPNFVKLPKKTKIFFFESKMSIKDILCDKDKLHKLAKAAFDAVDTDKSGYLERNE